MSNDKNLGKFMAKIAMSADEATKESIRAFQEELKQRNQEMILNKLREVHTLIERQVQNLRALRAREKAHLAEIRRLEDLANSIVSGKE